jgi:transposase
MKKLSGIFCLGIDVSKLTLDVSLVLVVGHLRYVRGSVTIGNTWEGLKELRRWLKQQGVCFNETTKVVMENTGMYHRLLLNWLKKSGLHYCVDNAARIKWSLGITRGKDDKVDAQRIAMYAAKNLQELQWNNASEERLMLLKDLLTTRKSLLQQIQQLQVPLNERKQYLEEKQIREMEKLLSPAIMGLKESLKKLDAAIQKTITSDMELLRLYKLALSVPAIGTQTAAALLCDTRAFKGYENAGQLSSYCGVVPFGYRSGTSIRGKNKVHPMANKNLKRLLHMCVLSGIRKYPEFKDYYERKIAEGKHAMSVINALRNKLVIRVAAVVKRGEPYIDNYVSKAV